MNKIRKNAGEIIEVEEEGLRGSDVVIVSYGINARPAWRAMELAHEKGIKVGMLRLITVWPFPMQRIAELADQVKGFVVPEINLGQMVLEVERATAGKATVRLVPHAGGGIHRPEAILDVIEEVTE
ncbi:MAG: transketolase C-terminal domain-containing protein [Candidatus Bipolaricaulota bacterium]|nr:transketolase C-terminal domain-containing protein [Candidatus Bipolaricaulota bacterium]